MRVREAFWSRAAGAARLVYTLVMRHRFARWGARSRIERPAKLVAPHLIAVGSGVHICGHAWLNAKDDRGDGRPTLEIGDGTYIGRFAQINAWRKVIIGRNVLVADRVVISDADHNFERPDAPIILQGDQYVGAVTLQEGCWIAAGAVLLPGVNIGRNAVVAANAVVTRDVPDRTVVGGTPARVIRTLNS